MDYEGLFNQLHQVKEMNEMLNRKEELLQTMKSIALEAVNAENSRRVVLNQSFQDLQSQLNIFEAKIQDSFHEFLKNSTN